MPSFFAFLLLLASSNWTETWQNGTANWTDGAGQPITTCSTAGNVLHATRSCAAQAFSNQRWDQTQPVQVSGTVRGQTVSLSPYFCGLALIEQSDHRVYGQAAVGRDISPIWPHDDMVHLVAWNDEYPNAESHYFYNKQDFDSNAWQPFSVTWSPAKQTWTFMFGGKTHSVHDNQVVNPLVVDLQGSPLLDDGSECQFGPVSVTGQAL